MTVTRVGNVFSAFLATLGASKSALLDSRVTWVGAVVVVLGAANPHWSAFSLAGPGSCYGKKEGNSLVMDGSFVAEDTSN